MIALLVAVALAHEPGACPPVSSLELAAQAGRLPAAGRACLEEVAGADVNAAWLLWTDRLVRDGSAPDLDALLARTTDPDHALLAAERLTDPAAAALALDRARALSDRWEGAVVRADRLPRMRAVADRIGRPPPDLLPPAPPTADDLVAASDLGHAWSRALWGRGYATERDAYLRAAEAAPPGPGRDALARLTLLLAVHRVDDPATTVVVHAVGVLLPGDPAVAAHGLVSGDQAGEGER